MNSSMKPLFNDRNELVEIRVGDVPFATGGGDLWTAVFAASNDLSHRIEVRAGDAAAFERDGTPGSKTSLRREAPLMPRSGHLCGKAALNGGGAPATTVLRWRDIPLGDERGVLDAAVEIETMPDGSQRWRISFDNRSANWGLFETSFPRLNRVMRDGEGDAMLPGGDHGARLYRSRRAQDKPLVVEYPAFTPMASAFFIGETGLYVAAEDPDARIKSFRIEGEQCVSFSTPVEGAGRPGLAAEGPRHAVTLAPLSGDWWDAARRYRDFALKQKWAARGPIRECPDYPRRFCEIPLWINIHAYPEEAERIRRRVKAVFPDFPTGIHWHLWQHSGHDVNYPEYFPEQKGTAEVMAAAKADNQEMLPYANGRLWSVSTSGYEMARPFAVRRADGSRMEETYAPTTPPLAVMCPCCEPWQRVIRRFTGRILDELGAGSLFLDQIGAAPGVPCFDPSHNHPVGGGGWWYDGYDRLLDPIHRKANARGAFLTTEGAAEFCLGMVDGYMQLTMRTPQDIPFANAVYSGYTTFFCSPENIDDETPAFRAMQARELLWGNELGWFLPEVLDRPDKCDVLRRLCAFRQENLDALAYGTLLDELRFAEPVPEQTYKWLGRRQNFMLFTDAWALTPSNSITLPDVIGYWWRTDKGETVLLAANLADEERTVRYLPCGASNSPEALPHPTLTLAPHELQRVG